MSEPASIDRHALTAAAARLLAAWARDAERWWYDIPGHPGYGCYGTGYNYWGSQTNQRYTAALATLAVTPGHDADRQWALERALASLRFALASHVSGDGPITCTDGGRWGGTWLSPLGVERMMHGVHAIREHLTEADRAALRRVITSEAAWLHDDYQKGSHQGVFADVWASTGKNVPESNLWAGALLWRAAAMYPDHPAAEKWRERAHEFLVNAVSIEADAQDGRIVAGKPIRDRFRGANFFPNYALDHHGYLNVGYMVICTSNAAMLHFDLRAAGLDRPESLDHHQDDLWHVVRRMIFPDGRLARLGGDSRVRYTYCQEYLLPSLLYAADHLGDAHALQLASRQVGLIEKEAAYHGDGSFYSRRLAWLANESPYYYTRLESDRAVALSMLLAYLPLVREKPPVFSEDFETSVAGHWVEPEHGGAMHRSATRLASFSWRAFGLTQGLCLPPDRSDLAEWSHNLAGRIRFLGEPESHHNPGDFRRLLTQHAEAFEGGFVTCGAVMEGCNLNMAEGWRGTDSATHWLAFAALPDGHTVACVQLCRVGARRAYTAEVKGLNLCIPNDLFNRFSREIASAGQVQHLQIPAEDGIVRLGSRWANIDDVLGVIGLYGAEELVVHRGAQRRGGHLRSLHVDQFCWRCDVGAAAHAPGATLLDVGWAVVSGVDAATTRRLAEDTETRGLLFDQPGVRGVSVMGVNGHRYALVANFGDHEAAVRLPSGRSLALAPGRATVV